jgi:DEAD/DEAH box helicase domain-containing protein
MLPPYNHHDTEGGRRGRAALTVMVLWNSPVEQHIARNPSYLFGRGVESIALDPGNAIVLRSHVLHGARLAIVESYTVN